MSDYYHWTYHGEPIPPIPPMVVDHSYYGSSGRRDMFDNYEQLEMDAAGPGFGNYLEREGHNEEETMVEDKVATSVALKHLANSRVLTINKEVWRKDDMFNKHVNDIWHDLLTQKLQCETLCVKPARDGCSTGVARLCCSNDLSIYIKALEDCLLRILPNSLSKV